MSFETSRKIDSLRQHDLALAYHRMAAINQATTLAERVELVGQAFGSCGRHLFIEGPLGFVYGTNISIGHSCHFNRNLLLSDYGKIKIGDDCVIGPNVAIYTLAKTNHHVAETKQQVTIGDNVLIGGASIIQAGVSLGSNVIVASHSHVTQSFGDSVMIGGSPARVIGSLDDAS